MATHFGVDSTAKANTVLQNNLTLYDWVVRNQSQPRFWGCYFGGCSKLTADEITFIHKKGTKITLIYNGAQADMMNTEDQGVDDAKGIYYISTMMKPKVPEGKAVFLYIDINSSLSADYLVAFADTLISSGYTPGFYANTDSNLHNFDHAFSQAFIKAPDTIKKCLVWALEPRPCL